MDNTYSPYDNLKNTYSADQNNKLKTFASMLQQSGSTSARPAGWFLNTGTKKVNIKPPQQGGKWLCTMLLRKHIISWKQFYMLARGHALAVIMFPNFAYWYLKYMGEIVRRAESREFNWDLFPAAQMEWSWNNNGFFTAFRMYKYFCWQLWREFGVGIPSPDRVRFGALKMFFHPWPWLALPRFIKYQWRLVRA